MKVRLTGYEKEDLFSGTIFQFKCEYNSTYTKKDHVLMLCECPCPVENASPFALYYIKGYYAGTPLLILPKEAMTKTPHTKAISRTWLEKNWKKYIYDCDPNDVRIKL